MGPFIRKTPGARQRSVHVRLHGNQVNGGFIDVIVIELLDLHPIIRSTVDWLSGRSGGRRLRPATSPSAPVGCWLLAENASDACSDALTRAGRSWRCQSCSNAEWICGSWRAKRIVWNRWFSEACLRSMWQKWRATAPENNFSQWQRRCDRVDWMTHGPFWRLANSPAGPPAPAAATSPTQRRICGSFGWASPAMPASTCKIARMNATIRSKLNFYSKAKCGHPADEIRLTRITLDMRMLQTDR